MKFLNNCNHTLITAGKGNLHVWEYDEVNNKLRPHAVKLGNLQRSFNCLAVSPTDDYAYCGTTSGDVLQVGSQRSCQVAGGRGGGTKQG